MAWTTPMTFVDGNVLTAPQLNTHLRDNMMETAPGRATVANSIFVSQGPFRIEERTLKSGRVDSFQQLTTSSYSDLSVVGPSVSVTTGTSALVFMNATITPIGVDTTAAMSFGITGRTERTASDKDAIIVDGVTGGNASRVGTNILVTGLTPGLNIFTAKYKSNGTNLSGFNSRFLGILPF